MQRRGPESLHSGRRQLFDVDSTAPVSAGDEPRERRVRNNQRGELGMSGRAWNWGKGGVRWRQRRGGGIGLVGGAGHGGLGEPGGGASVAAPSRMPSATSPLHPRGDRPTLCPFAPFPISPFWVRRREFRHNRDTEGCAPCTPDHFDRSLLMKEPLLAALVFAGCFAPRVATAQHLDMLVRPGAILVQPTPVSDAVELGVVRSSNGVVAVTARMPRNAGITTDLAVLREPVGATAVRVGAEAAAHPGPTWLGATAGIRMDLLASMARDRGSMTPLQPSVAVALPASVAPKGLPVQLSGLLLGGVRWTHADVPMVQPSGPRRGAPFMRLGGAVTGHIAPSTRLLAEAGIDLVSWRAAHGTWQTDLPQLRTAFAIEQRVALPRGRSAWIGVSNTRLAPPDRYHPPTRGWQIGVRWAPHVSAR